MSSTQRFPRFLTFGPGEREALLRESLGLPSDAPLPYEMTQRHGLVKACSFAVTYPDRTQGTCRYERRGPSFHGFHYTYRDGAILPVRWWGQNLSNYLPTIEAKGKEIAAEVYDRACTEERDRYFKRATPVRDGTRIVPPERPQMTAARAKELAGRYALCVCHGSRLLAVSVSFGTLAEANAAWKEKANHTLVVGCCNRLSRCWELPKFNPLYAVFDPRPAGAESSQTNDEPTDEPAAKPTEMEKGKRSWSSSK